MYEVISWQKRTKSQYSRKRTVSYHWPCSRYVIRSPNDYIIASCSPMYAYYRRLVHKSQRSYLIISPHKLCLALLIWPSSIRTCVTFKPPKRPSSSSLFVAKYAPWVFRTQGDLLMSWVQIASPLKDVKNFLFHLHDEYLAIIGGG